jgi:hypothetical protein
VQAANVEAARAAPPAGYVPVVGWDACELLARVGEPREVSEVETALDRSYLLTYRPFMSGRPGPSGLVTLAKDSAGTWRVDTVIWDQDPRSPR